MDKLIRWTIAVAILGAFLYFSFGLKQKQQLVFMSGVYHDAAARCHGEQSCLNNLKTHFKDCLQGNYESHAAAGGAKTYTIKQAAFDACLASHLTAPVRSSSGGN